MNSKVKLGLKKELLLHTCNALVDTICRSSNLLRQLLFNYYDCDKNDVAGANIDMLLNLHASSYVTEDVDYKLQHKYSIHRIGQLYTKNGLDIISNVCTYSGAEAVVFDEEYNEES